MPKLLAKKSALPPSAAHSLEEWHAQALQRYGTSSHTTALLLTPHNAALRIQLRYRVYKDKVRAIIRKTSDRVRDDSTNGNTAEVTANAVGTAKTRSVKGSSVALAVAYQTHHHRHGGGSAAAPSGKEPIEQEEPPLMVKKQQENARAYQQQPEVRSSIQDASVSWGSNEWSVPSRGFLVVNDDAEDTSGEKRSDSNVWKAKKMEETVMAPSHGINASSEHHGDGRAVVMDGNTLEEPQILSTESAPSNSRDHKFVNVMHHSWLLSSMEERCAEAAASLGARPHHKPNSPAHHQLSVLDIRHTVLDLLFIIRSGHSDNFHGREPSSVAAHHKNLVHRLMSSSSIDDHVRRRVGQIFDALKSDMILPAVRCLGWLLTKTWRMLFDGMHVDLESLQRMRDVLEAAATANGHGNVSVVFTPTHKTHLDYLIISYLCFAYGIPLPRIAAGDNLDLPVIGSFLRANGSFFIRRSFKNDLLYKQVLQHYVDELLHDGNPLEVFIEGGRSRHGRVCKPKMGFLNMFHEYTQHASNQGKDILLVPISLDYDRVFEVEEYANQLLGKPKQKESLRGFFSSLWDLVGLRLGHCYVRFGEPLSIQANGSLPLKKTGNELAVRMQTCGTVTSTSVVSALLMWKRQYATRQMLVGQAQWLVQELENRGATVARMETMEVLVDHALRVLHVEVSAQGVVVDAAHVSYPTRALEMGFYRNHLLHVFLPDMALLGALDALSRKSTSSDSGATQVVVDKTEVLELATWIWSFLGHICRHDSVDLALHLETLELRVSALTVSSTSVLIDKSKWRTSRLVGFVLSLHWSFVDSLLVASLAMWSFFRPTNEAQQATTTRSEREMLRLAQLVTRELFQANSISHAETFCSESIKQAFEFLQQIGMVHFVACPTTGGRLYTVQPAADTVEDNAAQMMEMVELHERIQSLRKPQATSLYRGDQAAPTLTRSGIDALVTRALREAEALALAQRNKGRSHGGVYASWMAAP